MAASAINAAENPSLPLVSPMFGDDMVLQRGKPIRFWGWGRPGEKVGVELVGKTAAAVCGADGRWQAELGAPAPGGPYTVKISGAAQSVSLHEVLVGDVWLCGGQSNMELGLSRVQNGEEEIKAANHPEIRIFKVPSHVAYAPAKVVTGSWKICSPVTAGENGGVSAVAYFFARRIQEETHVPVGLVVDCLGGTPAESWMSPSSLRALKDFDVPLDEIARLHAKGGPEYGSFLMHWLDEFDAGQSNHWSEADLDDSSWKPVQIPGGFSELGLADVPGICWFRKEFTLPDPLPAGKAVLHLGVVEKMDTAYLNGQWAGASSWVENPRAYPVNDGVLKPGKNMIAVRIFKNRATGGFMSKAEDLNLTLGDQTKIPLGGEWKGALSADCRPPHSLPLTYENYPTMPAVLFEGMIEPVAPLSIRGVIWYQGEANFQRAHQYRTLLPALIGDWRKVFQQGDFPFYIVGLPRFMGHRSQPGADGWAELREAQALTGHTVKNAGLTVTVDTGEADSIHPKDKQMVGERLALCALANAYGRKVAWAGPEYVSSTAVPDGLKLRFKNIDGGLVVKGERLGEFSVAGKDWQWHWADAKIDGDSVIVSSPQVTAPVAARYAWQANPEATLYNGAGLPAAPFRTDDWPGVTDEAKPW
ncbi:MAG TPA: sialate O-acetylesterase [Candidatus Acidoferrales bacterium]|nr:sialate O-acetylesterase [Candidatus Acidoferrales bacterium]